MKVFGMVTLIPEIKKIQNRLFKLSHVNHVSLVFRVPLLMLMFRPT